MGGELGSEEGPGAAQPGIPIHSDLTAQQCALAEAYSNTCLCRTCRSENRADTGRYSFRPVTGQSDTPALLCPTAARPQLREIWLMVSIQSRSVPLSAGQGTLSSPKLLLGMLPKPCSHVPCACVGPA